MNTFFLFVFFAALCASVVPGPARAAGGTMPSCAAGDPVVWENTSSKVYHMSGDKYYGTTKHGAYACKSAADGAGFHAAKSKGSSMKSSGAASSSSDSSSSDSSAAAPAPSPMASGKHHKHHTMSGSSASPAPAPSST